jgi:hypothetical protein
MEQALQSARVAEKTHPWDWFKDKILAPLFVALSLGICAASFATYQSVQSLTSQIAQHDRDIQTLRQEIKIVDAKAVGRAEIMEMMKRVELQLNYMLAVAGVKSPRLRLEESR